MENINSASYIAERQSLVKVALGQLPADVVIQNGTLLNTFSGELLPDNDVVISQGRIARLGTSRDTIGPKTKIIDAAGLFVVPGFIDSHYHIESSFLSPRRHAEVTLPLGLTSIFHGTHEIANVAGQDALDWLAECSRVLPQRIFLSIPSAAPPSVFETSGAWIGADEVYQLAPLAVGLGEVMDFAQLCRGDGRLWGVIGAAKEMGLIVEGHGSYASPQADAFAAAGITSSHSIQSGVEALELLRRGCDIQIQVRRSRDVLQVLIDQGFKDWHHIGIAVDDRHVDEMYENGLVDYEVRLAIEWGVDVITAYQMATINNALHWHMEDQIGVIAPGRFADILLISDLENVKIETVLTGGEVVARKGAMQVALDAIPPPACLLESIRLLHPIKPQDFNVPADTEEDNRKFPVLCPGVNSPDEESLLVELPVRDGLVQRDLEQEVNKVAIIERHTSSGNIGVGFWRIGFQQGAVAMSILHDSHNISVVGASDTDMALAANRVAAIQGGIVVVRNGVVLAEVPLPIGGLMTDEPVSELIPLIQKARDQISLLSPGKALGEDPLFALTFIYLTCHPRTYAQTDRGLFEVETSRKIR